MWPLKQFGLKRFATWREADSQFSSLCKQQGMQLIVFDERLRVLLNNDGQSLFNAAKLISAERNSDWLFLGFNADQAPVFSTRLSATQIALSADMTFADLRGLLPVLSENEVAPIAHAKALHHWHQSHHYCGFCGSETRSIAAGHERYCQQCDSTVYPRTDPAAIMAITHQERLLLARNPQWPENQYSVLAGFVEPGESFEQAVKREVLEEVGINVESIEYFGSQPWPFPHSIMIGFFAQASHCDINMQDEELETAFWVTAPELEIGLEDGTIKLPTGGAISFALIEDWARRYGIDVKPA
jgi:NAD+ diphosphatase